MTTDPRLGLSDAEAASRLIEHGANVIRGPQRRGFAHMLASQFRDTSVMVLIAAGIVAAIIGEVADVAAIAVIVVLNAALGALQEFRAERALDALRQLAAPVACVRRSGESRVIPAAEIVPGDVLLLEAGNVVPADARIAEVSRCSVEEAALTGESVPVYKTADPVVPGAELGDRRDMVFQGTAVATGRAVAIVTATGMRTELGRIASLLSDEAGVQTPLQRRLALLGRRLALIAVSICALILVLGIARGERPMLMLMTALSVAVAAIPEALPAVVTMSLAIGARRLVKQHALVRRLAAVESLGSVTYICTDKTGTLTENKMRVEHVSEATPELLTAIALCNDARGGSGDPMEVALLEFAASRGFVREDLERTAQRVDELPFTADRARVTTVHRCANDTHGVVAYTKGAPEGVIASCGNGPAANAEDLLDKARELASEGLRVLAVSMRSFDEPPADPLEYERGQTFVGLVALVDPPRASAAEAVAIARRAGIQIVMITGDHAATGFAIAKRIGIATEPSEVMLGSELRALSDVDLDARIEHIRVYARVAPEDKIRIVKALQARGELVAMTGDGVNDAPALKRAEIGVAMGRVGTDSAREASSLVLLDDDFATIVTAVREGRRAYDNIRKFVRYTLAGNAGELWPLLLAPLFGLPLPLLPLQILWINLVTDGLPGLALASERAERNVMMRPPRPPSETILGAGLWQHTVWVGALIGALTLATQAWFLGHDASVWRTMTFTVLTFAQMGHVLAIRSERDSLLAFGLLSNRPLAAAVALTVALQLAVIYAPPLQGVFGTTALSAGNLLVAIGCAMTVTAAVELEKAVRRRLM